MNSTNNLEYDQGNLAIITTMERQMKRNISLVYILTALNYSWFWIAIWVLFYLRFIDYAGIGILESVMITTSFLGEIPTGAIGDLLGKKKTLILAFLLSALGNLTMGLSPSFGILLIMISFIALRKNKYIKTI